MSENDKPRPPAATFSFLLHSGEILDRDGKPSGVTLQDQAAAEARLAAYLAIDPELKNVPKEPKGPAQAALMELVRFLARRVARQWITAGAIEGMVGHETKALRKHTETASPQCQPRGDVTLKQPADTGVEAVAGRPRLSRMPCTTNAVRQGGLMNRSLTRQELYDLVWSEPMRTLAPQLGVSDVALAKTCRNHDIPIPPRGYWAKLQAGKKVGKPPLPFRGLGKSEVIRAGGRHSWYHYEAPKNLIDMEIPPPPVFSETIEDLTARIRKLVGRVPIPRDLTKAHRAIARLLEEDAVRRQKYLAASYRSYWDAPLFDSPFERRRLRLVNAIFIALERCGMRASLRGKDPTEFDLRVGDEVVTFKLDHPKQEQRWGHRSESELNRPASEKLLLRISPNRKLEGLKLAWEDEADQSIENAIEDIVVTLVLAGEVQYRQGEQHHHDWLIKRKAQLIEDARKQKEEEERKERERRIREEKMRVERLLSEAVAFRQANDIRSYVALVRETSRSSAEPVNQQELEAWAAWALAQADRIDPVRSRKFLAAEPEGS